MFTLLQLFIGIQLDLLFGETRRFHPLVGFGRLAHFIDQLFDIKSSLRNRFTGLLSVLTLVVPISYLVWWLCDIPMYGVFFSMVFFYLTLGGKSLIDHANNVYKALSTNEIETARQTVGLMVSRDTSNMDESQVSLACVESVLENGNDAVFGTIFWFVLLGAPGAVGFRLINTLDAMWGYRTEQYQKFGWAAARLDDLLNLIPARLCALTYAFLGNTKVAFKCWQQQAKTWESPNAGPVMAAGAGALNIQLGGAGMYHGERKMRPILGQGSAPHAEDIKRAMKLVQFGTLVWILVIAAIIFAISFFNGSLRA